MRPWSPNETGGGRRERGHAVRGAHGRRGGRPGAGGARGDQRAPLLEDEAGRGRRVLRQGGLRRLAHAAPRVRATRGRASRTEPGKASAGPTRPGPAAAPCARARRVTAPNPSSPPPRPPGVPGAVPRPGGPPGGVGRSHLRSGVLAVTAHPGRRIRPGVGRSAGGLGVRSRGRRRRRSTHSTDFATAERRHGAGGHPPASARSA